MPVYPVRCAGIGTGGAGAHRYRAGDYQDVLYLLTELKESSRAGQRQWEIEQIVRRGFNYQDMAQRALGELGRTRRPPTVGSSLASLCRCCAMISRNGCGTILPRRSCTSPSGKRPTAYRCWSLLQVWGSIPEWPFIWSYETGAGWSTMSASTVRASWRVITHNLPVSSAKGRSRILWNTSS